MSNPGQDPGHKCGICGLRGHKGWFRVPKDDATKRQWQIVIPIEVTLSTRVCFRHWIRDHLEVTSGGKASFKKGMRSEKSVDKTKAKPRT